MGHRSKFFWYQLMARDSAAAGEFYARVVGWNVRDAGGENSGYRIASAGERGVAGIAQICAEAEGQGLRPGWIGYVAVDDVDSAADAIAAAGGRVLGPPADIPNVGRFAIVADPQGASFMLLAPNGEGEMAPLARMAPGNVGWHELYTTDWESAFGFYSERFGWTKDRTVDMGEMGTYQLFAPAQGEEAIGGMMNMPQLPSPAWGFYFVVDGVEAAAERVKAAGGEVVMGPMQVPDGSFVIQGRDPEGTMFALVSTTR
jgi:predicted enzyme related to lactoylglutathione lyase